MTEQSAWQRRAELEADVDAAKVEEQRIRQQQADAAARTARLREKLAARPPDEWDDHGQPVAKSEAARLAEELDATNGTVFADRVRAAELRTRSARVARDRFTADNIRELVADREPDARALVEEFDDLVDQLDKSIVGLSHFAASWSPMLATVPGLEAHRELPTYDDLSGLRRVLRGYRDAVPLPLPKSIVTPDGEQPPRVPGPRGDGWVSPAHAESSAVQERKHAEQPERDAQRAARNPIPTR